MDRDFASILPLNPTALLAFVSLDNGHSDAFPCGTPFLGVGANELSSVLLSPQVISTQRLFGVPRPFELSFRELSLFPSSLFFCYV